MEKNSFKNLLRRTVVVPIVALAILAAVLLLEIQSLTSSLQSVDHTDQVIAAGQQLIKLVIDMESGVRGYLGSGKEAFLQPYNEAKPSIDAKFDALNRLVADNPAQQARLSGVRRHFDEWQAYGEQRIELRRSTKSRLEANLQGKQLMDAMRAEHDAFIATEDQLHVERVRVARRASRMVSLTCALLSLGIGGFLAFYTRGQMRLLGAEFQQSLETAEKRAEGLRVSEEALRESEAQFRTLANAIPQLCWMANADGFIFWYNERWYEYTGTMPAQMEGWGWQSVHDPETLPKVLERWKASIASGVPFDMVFPMRGGDGVFRPFLTRVMPVKDGAGKVVRWFGTNTDISAQKRAEEALQESEERLQLFIEHAPAALAMFDTEMRYLSVSRRWLADYGLGDRDVRGVPHYEIFPEVSEQWRAIHRLGLSGEVLRSEADLFERADGSAQWIRREIRPWYDKKGEVGGIVIFAEEITARKRAEEAQRKSEERWATTLQSIGDAVISTDATGHIEFMNEVAERLTGWPLAEAKGTELSAVFNIVQETTRIRPEDPVSKVIRLGKVVGLANHTALIRRDGTEIPIDDSGAPIRNREGQIEGVVLVFHDVSEQRKVEKALRNSDRLATTGRLAATIAHEIHNPLDAVGNLLFILGQDAPDAITREYVAMASQELSRVTQLTQQMLTFQREAAKPVPVKIGEILDSVLALFERKIQSAGVTLNRQVKFDGNILGLPGELRQMFANLVGNAIEAVGPRHGTIWLRAYESRDWRGERRGLRVVVADDGPGIPADIRASIFEPFFTTKGENGTGLGLWITSAILRKYEGTLRLRTSTRGPGSGTCFSVFFPFETMQREARPEARSLDARLEGLQAQADRALSKGD
jgi:PAS domain S-box-containing protein